MRRSALSAARSHRDGFHRGTRGSAQSTLLVVRGAAPRTRGADQSRRCADRANLAQFIARCCGAGPTLKCLVQLGFFAMPGVPSAWVEFPGFRRYEMTRQDANNAMMALLAGSKLAAHTLQLTAGSRQLLPDIFPGVEHIGYFNLRTDKATELLMDTGHHLGAVAVPYALAVHEDFAMTTLELLQKLGHVRKAPGDRPNSAKNSVKAWNVHEALYMTLGQPCPARGLSGMALEHFHLLREMRNAQIHDGGAISSRLEKEVTAMSSAAAADWFRLAQRKPSDVIASGHLRFTTSDIFAAFATTKTLGRRLNTLLRDHLTRSEWARIAVDDYALQSSKSPHSDAWMRGVLGHAALYYGTVNMTEQDVVNAAVAAGHWSQNRNFVARRASRGAAQFRNRGTLYPGTAKDTV